VGKTEQQLINEALKRGGIFHVDTVRGRGAKGGKITAGMRERKALTKLILAKRVKILQEDTNIEYNSGWGLHYSTIVFQLI